MFGKELLRFRGIERGNIAWPGDAGEPPSVHINLIVNPDIRRNHPAETGQQAFRERIEVVAGVNFAKAIKQIAKVFGSERRHTRFRFLYLVPSAP